MYETLREYSAGELVPTKERALRDSIQGFSRDYDTVAIETPACRLMSLSDATVANVTEESGHGT